MRGLWRGVLVALLSLVVGRAMGNVREVQMSFLSLEDGLSHQTVNCFCQDEFGFIWIGTQDGLNRFDGRMVDRFRPDGSPYSIASNNIRQLYSDHNGSIYLRSHTCIERYDQRLKRFEVIYAGDIQAMACDSTHLYFVEGKRLLSIDHREEAGRHTPRLIFSFAEAQLDPGSVTNLAITKRGLVFSTGKLGVMELVDGEVTHHEAIASVYALHYEPTGYLWVATRNHGLYRFDEQWQMTHFLHRDGDSSSLIHNNVRAVVSAGEGLYYVASFGGLQMLDLATGKFTLYNYEQESGIKLRSIISMFCDEKGTLWMGTFHCGVHYYHSTSEAYRFYRVVSTHPGELTSPMICAITEDGAGNLWLGTEGNGLICFSLAEERFELFDRISANEVVKALYYDSERNELWAATLFHGIYRIDLQRGRVDHINPNVLDVLTGRNVGKAHNPTRIIEDGRGHLLVCCRLGLVRLDREQMRFEAIDNEAFFRRDVSQIWDLALDGDDLWMATAFDVMRFSRTTGKVDHYSFADISGTNAQKHILHLKFDRAGRLYLGSSGAGVFRYNADTDAFEHLGPESNMGKGFITGIAVGSGDDNLYVAYSQGLGHIDSDGRVEDYSILGGSSLSNINEGGLHISRNGHLFICGPQGILKIHPDQFIRREADYAIYIKDVLVDNRPVMPLDSLHLMESSSLYEQRMVLPSRHSSVSFRMAGNNYRNFPPTEMEYRLEGFDADFTKVDHSTLITYMNLKAGRYRFVVRGVRNEATDTSPETSFELRVRAPLYARTWFQLLVGLILAAIFFKLLQLWLHRQRLEQMLRLEQMEKQHIEQVNTQKLRFFTNLSHEFRTPLTLITGQVEMLLTRRDLKPSIYNKVLNIYRNSQRLKHMVDEIIDIRRLEQSKLRLQVMRDDLVSTAKSVFLSFHDFAAQHHIEFRFDAPEEVIEADFDSRQIERVLNNLLSNAFKYTHERGAITVSLTADAEEAHIAVTDTGIGIATEHLNHIFERFWQEEQANAAIEQYGSGIGLSLAKNLVEMHEGHIEVESVPGRGTTFRVHLPRTMRRNNPQAIFVAPSSEPHIELPERPEPAEMATEKPEKLPRILLVEDNAEMQEILRQVFDPFYQVSVASNGRDGLELARKEQPDLVVSDIMMPIMSGLELCKQLKTELETSHIPVVLLTAYNTEEHTIEGLLTGADDYVAKPFNVRILLARCNNIIVQRHRLQAKFRNSVEPSEPQLTVNPYDKKLLDDAIAIVEQHLADSEFDVAAFASELGLSRTLLFTKLKGITGQTPNELILSIRLKKALLRIDNEPAVSIAEIAYDLGFSTPSYFIRCFRTRFGMTPNAYRKQKQG